MSVFRDTSIEWAGKTYTLTPTMRLLHKIEAGDQSKNIGPISLARVTADAMSAQPQLAKMSHVVELVMRDAGAKDFTEDEFYQEMTSGDRTAAIECWHLIVQAISPMPKEGKDDAVPDTE